MQQPTKEFFKKISQKLEKEMPKYPVSVVYIHGSYAQGYAREESDLDVAVLFEEGVAYEERYSYRLKLQDYFFEFHPQKDDIDLVSLNDASLLLRYNVMVNGRIVYNKDDDVRADFEYRTLRDFDDQRYFMEQESKVFLDSLGKKRQ